MFDFKNETILYRISSMSLINGTPPVTTVYPLSTPLIPPISKVSISSDNLLAAAVDEGGLIHVWPLCMDPKKSKIFTHLVHPGFRVLHCIFSPSSKHTTQHLDVSSMLDCSGVLEKKGMESDQNDAILSRQKNCYQIVTCGSDCISRLWTITTESNENMEGSIIKLDLEFKGHDRWIWDATFTADGGYMLTASSDGCAKLWCTSGDTINDAVCTFKGHQKGLTSIFLNDFP